MSAVSARRCDARQTGLPSRRVGRVEYRRDRRDEQLSHRLGAPTLQHVAAPAGAAGGPETRAAGAARATQPAERREQVGAFYARQASWLRRVVATRVLADEHTIDDACAHAWERLSADPRIVLDRSGLAWLAKVAIREGWRLSAIARRERPAVALTAALGEADDERAEEARPGVEEDALARAEHDDRLNAFQTLKCRERRDLFLQALGYRYDEIAAMTGSSYTAVNRRLAEGRAELRRRRDAASRSAATSV
jgi:DNA-directed RNA polymerase specialized sigma24 family protein